MQLFPFLHDVRMVSGLLISSKLQKVFNDCSTLSDFASVLKSPARTTSTRLNVRCIQESSSFGLIVVC